MKTRFTYNAVTRELLDANGKAIAIVLDARQIDRLVNAPLALEALTQAIGLLQTSIKAADLRGSGQVLSFIHRAIEKGRLRNPNVKYCEQCEATFDAQDDWCPTCFEREAAIEALVDANEQTLREAA